MARIWRLIGPIRWLISTNLWILSKLLQGLSMGLMCIHVAIDYTRLLYLDYTARPDDVFIDTYPRSGTTWMQMIMYQLTTDGRMDFGHIADVCPWFERAAFNKRNLHKMPSPRIFKSHLPYIWIPRRKCRYIYVARDGKDVAVSFYHFYKSHLRYKGTFEQFFRRYVRGWVIWGSWFYHVSRWWRHRHDPNVLCLRYEDLLSDLEGCVRRIIAFCELDVPEERLPEILHRCSFEFMKEHEAKFDFATEVLLEHGFTPGTFIRSGQSGQWQSELDKQQTALFDEKYERCMGDSGLDD